MPYILLGKIYLHIKLNQPKVAQLRHKSKANSESITIYGCYTGFTDHCREPLIRSITISWFYHIDICEFRPKSEKSL